MNTPTQYANSPVKSCLTCVHHQPNEYGFRSHGWCVRHQTYCSLAVKEEFNMCGTELKHWRPKPPRRSLRQWLYDTFLK